MQLKKKLSQVRCPFPKDIHSGLEFANLNPVISKICRKNKDTKVSQVPFSPAHPSQGNAGT